MLATRSDHENTTELERIHASDACCKDAWTSTLNTYTSFAQTTPTQIRIHSLALTALYL